MTNLYTDDDYIKAKKNKKTLLTIYFAVIAVLLAVCLVLFV